jgi:hypothetical protein
MKKTLLLFVMIFICAVSALATTSNYTYYENFFAHNYNTSFWNIYSAGGDYFQNGTNPGLWITTNGANFPFFKGRAIPNIGNDSHPTTITFNVNFGLNHTLGANEYFGIGIMPSNLTLGSWSFLSIPPTTCGVWVWATGTDGSVKIHAHSPFVTTTLGTPDNLNHKITITIIRRPTQMAFGYNYDGVVGSITSTCSPAADYSAYVFARKAAGTDVFGFNVFDYEETSQDSNSTLGNSTLYDIDYPCSSNSDCISGLCTSSKCSCLGGGKVPYDSSQCCTHEVFAGKCTEPTLEQFLTKSKNDLVGDDTGSSNIICIVIIILVGLGIITASKAQVFGNVAAAFAMFALAILFTSIGWMSVFLLLGFILVILAAIVLFVVLGQGG